MDRKEHPPLPIHIHKVKRAVSNKSLVCGISAITEPILTGCVTKPSAEAQPPVAVTLRNPYGGVGNASLSTGATIWRQM